MDSLELPGAIHHLGPQELTMLKEAEQSDTTKVLNLRKILTATVDKEGGSKPFLFSIGERAQELADAYEDRQLTTRQVLEEFERLAREYVEADEQRRQLGVDENTFGVYRTLAPMKADLTPDGARAIDAIFARFPEYQWNEAQRATLRATLYKALRPVVGPAKMIEAANVLLRLQRV